MLLESKFIICKKVSQRKV